MSRFVKVGIVQPPVGIVKIFCLAPGKNGSLCAIGAGRTNGVVNLVNIVNPVAHGYNATAVLGVKCVCAKLGKGVVSAFFLLGKTVKVSDNKRVIVVDA